MTGTISFDEAFQALTGHVPMRWQCRLYDQMMQSRLRKGCDLPTGLGKTSVIPIWLIALASQAGNESVKLPRRLIYIVNRRTVVDQATDMVEQMRTRLFDPNNPEWQTHSQMLVRLAGELRKLSAGFDDLPLAISTLRGELADNEEWKVDPARPAIIVGTIDMIGSKLLFSGYGDGRYYRPHHAGLIGQDSLIVHDEAHLTPAFSDVLHHIAKVQHQAGELRSARVIELSATLRGEDGNVFKLEPEDEEDQIVRDRLDATKRLRLHEVEEADVIAKLIELSKAHDEERVKVLIYVHSPKDAQNVADQLEKQLNNTEKRVAVLTGTIRGHERDRMVKANPVYQALLNHEYKVEQTVYLVSTSAGEVGIDLDADHMVCDLTTLDSMIQRLGRVNRRGGQARQAQVDVVAGIEKKSKDKTSPIKLAIESTLAILKRWTSASEGVLNVCPWNLRTLVDGLDDKDRSRAFSPKPPVPPLTDILLDAWSLTSILRQMPGRMEAAPYLHGLTNDPPETYIVWRKEVALLHAAGADEEALHDWFQACRIQARERLRDRTDLVQETLEALLKAHRKQDKNCDFPVVLLNEHGEAEWSFASKIAEKDSTIAYRTIVLPPETGGLNKHGMLDVKVHEDALDVAEAIPLGNKSQRRERWLLTRDAEGERYKRLITGETAKSLPQDLREQERVTLLQPLEGTEDEGKSRYLLLMVQPAHAALGNPETAKANQALDDHTRQVVGHMNRIADALRLPQAIKNALVMAAERHDQGKDRTVWQYYARNENRTTPLAKSTRYRHPGALGGYRHEFGSLLDAMCDAEIQTHSERDLVLHLITTHHGWARPYFESRAFDNKKFSTSKNEEAVAEVMQRFGRLQQHFGRWSLTWLESLLRCADIAASKAAAGEAVLEPMEREVQI